MKNAICILLLAPFLWACASVQPAASTCGTGWGGHTETKLDYKEDDIDMQWKTKASRKSEFWIKLRPSNDFREKLVTIVGVKGELPDGTPTSPAWLNAQGRWTTQPGRKFVLCVPDVPPETEYKFDVIIEDIGTLDPRLEVTQ